MVYDGSNGTAYLFGGVDKRSPQLDYSLFDVWSFNSATESWNLLFNSDSFYNAFQRDAIAFDPDASKIVLFSTFVNCKGVDPASCGVETWIYDIRINAFRNVTSGTEPSLRWGSRMVYDSESRRAILFGGSDGRTEQTLNETWAFDFETNAWVLMSPAISPPPHHFAAMVYHPTADRVILFGGYNIKDSAALNDTWSYDYNKNAWVNLNPGAAPSPRLYHAMTWDLLSKRMILFGGISHLHGPVLGDTWVFDFEKNSWKEVTAKASPQARAWHVMVGTSQGTLLFGGSPQHDRYTYDDTWIYDSRSDQWKELSPGSRIDGEESRIR